MLRIRTNHGIHWPPFPRADMSPLLAAYQSLDETQWLSVEAIEEGQLAQARLLLSHCASVVPYYRNLFEREGIDPSRMASLDDFRRIPFLERRTYQEHYSSFCAESLPEGIKPARTIRTSGTSGISISVQQTNLVNFWWLAFYLRDLVWMKIDPRKTLAAIRPVGGSEEERKLFLNGARIPYWNRQLDQLIETGPSYGMEIHQDLERQAEWLAEIQPDYLLSHPSNLVALLRPLRKKGIILGNLEKIQSIGETLSRADAEAIAQGLGAPVCQTYSCSESGFIASPCPEGHGLHVHVENVIVEVVNTEGQPCQPGETGEVVLTTLHNFLTPFVRYRIQDQVTLAEHPCPCGRSLSLLTSVEGKQRPLLRLPNGKEKSPVQLVEWLQHSHSIEQFQIHQLSRERICFRLVTNSGWGMQDRDALKQECSDYFEQAIEVEIEECDRLPISPGGKAQDIVIEKTV